MAIRRSPLRLPVVSEGAEYLVMGMLMRRNILTYKAPPMNEGHDLIAIHPDPRYDPAPKELTQVRIQVKSRYQTDCDRGFPLRPSTINAFDYVVVVFQNIGKFYGRNNGLSGEAPPEIFTLPREFVRKHHSESGWRKVRLRGLESTIEKYRNVAGFEQIAADLGVRRPHK